MTTTTAPVPTTPAKLGFIDSIVAAAEHTITDLLSGEKKLVDIDGAVVLSGGKFYFRATETLIGKTFSQSVELDPAVAFHLAENGVTGLVGKLFGKK